MRLPFICLLLVFSSFLKGQTLHRAFLAFNPEEERVRICADEQSVFVLRNLKGERLDIIHFDQELQEQWAVGITVPGLELTVAEIFNDQLTLFLTGKGQKRFQVLEIARLNGHYAKTGYQLKQPFYANRLTGFKDTHWVSGFVGNRPVAFGLDAETGTMKALPIGHAQPVKSIDYLHFDENSRTLDILLRTSFGSYQGYVLRSINRDGRVAANYELFLPEESLGQVAFTKNSRGILTAATVVKANLETVKAIATIKGPENELEHRLYPLAEFEGVEDQYTLTTDFPIQIKKRPRHLKGRLDAVKFDEEAITISLEAYEKSYEVRGQMQRESDQQSLVDQIDLNRYGRRDFDVDEGTLNDRVDNFSNTEASAYRFRELIIDRVQEQGVDLVANYFLQLDSEGAKGLKFRMPKALDSPFHISQQNFRGPLYLTRTTKDWLLVDLKEIGNPRLLGTWTSSGLPYTLLTDNESSVLTYGFVLVEKRLYLVLEKQTID